MNDPVKHCSVYKEIGCSHVDGYLCDYPDCSILKDYKMNERIKELMGKTLDSEFSHTWDTMTYEGLLQFSEKFAELIVQECTEVINDGVLNSDGSGDWYTGYVAGATECRRKIKQHFEVEE